jgi:hypothetical protein
MNWTHLYIIKKQNGWKSWHLKWALRSPEVQMATLLLIVAALGIVSARSIAMAGKRMTESQILATYPKIAFKGIIGPTSRRCRQCSTPTSAGRLSRR